MGRRKWGRMEKGEGEGKEERREGRGTGNMCQELEFLAFQSDPIY